MLRTLLCLLAVSGTVGAVQDLPPDMLIDDPGPTPFTTNGNDSRDVHIADFDLDTNLDVLVVNMNGVNEIAWGDGFGNFTAGTAVESGSLLSDVKDSRGVAVADVDGDGDLDVYITHSSNQTNDLFLNQAASPDDDPRVFVKADAGIGGAAVSDTDISRRAVFFDADNDCDLDLYVANFAGQDNALYLNTLDPVCLTDAPPPSGDGGPLFVKADFATAGDPVADGGNSYGLAVGDYDDDGDLDLFVGNHSGIPFTVGDPNPGPEVPSFLYRNDTVGGGVSDPIFDRVEVGPVATEAGNVLCAEFADIDGDDDLDLFVGQTHGRPDRLYINQGGDQAGVLGEYLRVTLEHVGHDRGETAACLFVDIDDDGDLDLVVGRRKAFGPSLMPDSLYLNRGGLLMPRQRFGPLAGFSGPADQNTYGLAAGDLDGDGVVDLVFANIGGQNAFMRNLGRQWEDLEPGFQQGGGTTMLPGEGGVAPNLGSRGNMLVGEHVWLDVADAKALVPYALVIGITQNPIPIGGWTFIPQVDFVITGMTDAVGEGSVRRLIPPGIPFLTEFFVQGLVQDGASVTGFSATNAIKVRSP